MDTAIRAAVTALAILILVGTSLATQPSLPTVIYGSLVLADSTPAPGIMVTATWTDSTGNEQSITTATLSASEAPGPSLIGYFFFNQGYIQAKEGTEILVKIGDIERKVLAAPGGEPVRVDTITIALGRGAYAPTAPTPGKPTIGTATNPGMREPGSELPELDDSEGTAGETLPGDGSLPEEDSGDAGPPPGLPTYLSGQLTDATGKPLPGEAIVATYTDLQGQERSIETETLTEDEAERLGNTSLAGAYFFNKGEIEAKPATIINLSLKDATTSDYVEAQPGESVRKDLHSRAYAWQASNDNAEPGVTAGQRNATLTQRQMASFAKTLTAQAPYVLLFILLGVLALGIVYRQKVKTRMQSMVSELGISGLRRSMKKIEQMRVKSLMNREVVTCTEEEPIIEVINKFIEKNIGVLIVMRGKQPVGLITERDVLRRIDVGKSLDTMKARDAMSSPLRSVPQSMKLSELLDFSLKNMIRKIPVIQGRKLRGIVTQTDIARVYDRFFAQNQIETPDQELIGPIMVKKYVLLNQQDMADYALQLILAEHADCGIVVQKGVGDNRTRKIAGILTERNVLDEMYNNPLMLSKLQVGQIATADVLTVTPGTSVFKANKMMLKHNIRRLPVVAGGEPAGLVTQTEILQAVSSHFKFLASKEAGVRRV